MILTYFYSAKKLISLDYERVSGSFLLDRKLDKNLEKL